MLNVLHVTTERDFITVQASETLDSPTSDVSILEDQLPDDQDLHDVQLDETVETKEQPTNPWLKVERIVRLLASLGVLAVAAMAFLEYRNSNADLKRNRSLVMVSEWNDKGFTEKFRRVATFVESKRKNGELVPKDLPENMQFEGKKNLGKKWAQEIRSRADFANKRLDDDIDTITLFFSRMEICAAAQLCDREVLKAYFQTEVISFWAYFRGYAKQRQIDGYSAYGSLVDRLYASFRSGSNGATK